MPSPGSAGWWRRLEITGLGPRTVGLATSRRSRATAPARAVTDAVRHLLATEGPGVPGVRMLSQPERGESSHPDGS